MRVAVFVDAGFLYARCSIVLTGAKLPRTSVDLNQGATLNKLMAVACERATGSSLLRIYWYDGVLHTGPSAEQRSLADTDNVKMRLGVVNPYGQQKGVDSLIVTDLVELARNHAISDAVLLSGDEDVRIGVQIAQSFGVRVHLIGVGSGEASQSRTLMQEADTRIEWGKDDVADIFATKPSYEKQQLADTLGVGAPLDSNSDSTLDNVAKELVASLSSDQVHTVSELGPDQLIPSEYDGRLLAESRTRLERTLVDSERHYLRKAFRDAALEAANTL